MISAVLGTLLELVEHGMLTKFDVSGALKGDDAAALQAAELGMEAALCAVSMCSSPDVGAELVSDELVTQCAIGLKHHLLRHVFPVSDPTLPSKLAPGTAVKVRLDALCAARAFLHAFTLAHSRLWCRLSARRTSPRGCVRMRGCSTRWWCMCMANMRLLLSTRPSRSSRGLPTAVPAPCARRPGWSTR